MEGLASSVGGTPGLTFTYTAADIQGLAESSGPPKASAVHAQASSSQITSGAPALATGAYQIVAAPLQLQQPKGAVILTVQPSKPQPRIRGRMTPYAFFVQQRRDFYRRQGVPVQFTEFSKECSSLWKTTSTEEKEKFQKLAEEDRERYRREMTGEYVKPLARDGTRRGRRKKEPGQPKRNMCAFLHFCLKNRPKLKQENPSLGVGALAKRLAVAWKLLSPEQKKPFNEMAEKDKQRYEQQKQAYEAGYSAAILQRDLSSSLQPGVLGHTVTRHRRRKKAPDMPRRNMSGFMFYSLEKRPEIKAQNPAFGVGQLAQRLAVHWKQMNAEEKGPYGLMARRDKERYVTELQLYKKGTYTGATVTPHQLLASALAQLRREREEKEGAQSDTEEEGSGSGEGSEEEEEEGEGEEPREGESRLHSDLEQLCEFYQ